MASTSRVDHRLNVRIQVFNSLRRQCYRSFDTIKKCYIPCERMGSIDRQRKLLHAHLLVKMAKCCPSSTSNTEHCYHRYDNPPTDFLPMSQRLPEQNPINRIQVTVLCLTVLMKTFSYHDQKKMYSSKTR